MIDSGLSFAEVDGYSIAYREAGRDLRANVFQDFTKEIL